MKKGEQLSSGESVAFENPKAKRAWKRATSTPEGQASLERALQDRRMDRLLKLAGELSRADEGSDN